MYKTYISIRIVYIMLFVYIFIQKSRTTFRLYSSAYHSNNTEKKQSKIFRMRPEKSNFPSIYFTFIRQMLTRTNSAHSHIIQIFWRSYKTVPASTVQCGHLHYQQQQQWCFCIQPPKCLSPKNFPVFCPVLCAIKLTKNQY